MKPAVAPIDRGYDYQTSPVDNNMLLISSDDLIDTVNFDNDECLLFGDLENGDNATVLPEVYDSGAEMRLRSLLCENDSGLHAHCVEIKVAADHSAISALCDMHCGITIDSLLMDHKQDTECGLEMNGGF